MSDLQLNRDDYQEIAFTVKQLGGAYSLSGTSKIWFLIKNNLDDGDAAAIVTKTLANSGITVTSPAAGTGKIVIEGGDLSALLATQAPLYYALKILDSTGKPRTVAKGQLFVAATAVKAVS